MGTTLTGTTPQDTYDSLIKVTDNGPLTGSLKKLTDGLGNDSSLSLSTAAASLSGTLAVTGNATFDTNTLFVDAANNRVGVGTTSPLQLLYLQGSAVGANVFSGIGMGDADSERILVGYNPLGITAGLVPPQIIAGVSSLFLSSRDIVGGDIVFQTGSGVTEKMRITSAGVLSLTQGQIQFPATQVASANANTLDDYEEGTWTMGLSFGGASVDVTTSSNTGTYTKIGRQVTVNGYLVLTNKGSSTGQARITGLPFTIGGANSFYSTAAVQLGVVTFTNQYSAIGGVGTTAIELYEATILGVVTTITDADFANTSNAVVSLTYFV